MIKSLILSAIAMLTSVGVSSGNAQRSASVLNELKPKELIRLNASYDDSSYSISLTVDELNNYTWNNFIEYYDSISGSGSYLGTITYNSFENKEFYYSNSSYTLSSQLQTGSSGTLYLCLNDKSANSEYSGKWYLYQTGSNSSYSQLEYGITITINPTYASSYYNNFKHAIELDIVANTSSNDENMPSIADIFGEIASSITSFITTLGSAFNGVTSLFYDATNSSFTFLGVLVLIGCGVGLVYGAYRVIKGLMHRV